MLDLITLTKQNLSVDEVNNLVRINNLQLNTQAGVIYYNNLLTKNLEQHQGVFMQIDCNNTLKVECSLHKYYNAINNEGRQNYNTFTLQNAIDTFLQLYEDKLMWISDLRITAYEIGVNLTLPQPCEVYLNETNEIDAKKLYVYAKYRDERIKTTVFAKNTRKYYKLYDKQFQLLDTKARHLPPPELNILRCETVHRRHEYNNNVLQFFLRSNLERLLTAFSRQWNTLKFNRILTVPKGVGRAKKAIIENILTIGAEKTLSLARQQHSVGTLTAWEFRNIREFIQNDWERLRPNVLYSKQLAELEFNQALKHAIEQIKS